MMPSDNNITSFHSEETQFLPFYRELKKSDFYLVFFTFFLPSLAQIVIKSNGFFKKSIRRLLFAITLSFTHSLTLNLILSFVYICGWDIWNVRVHLFIFNLKFKWTFCNRNFSALIWPGFISLMICFDITQQNRVVSFQIWELQNTRFTHSRLSYGITVFPLVILKLFLLPTPACLLNRK